MEVKAAELEKYFNVINVFGKISGHQDIKVIFGPNATKVNETVKTIDVEISALFKGAAVQTKISPEQIQGIIAILTSIAMEKELTPPVKDYVGAATMLISLWNFYLKKDEQLETGLRFINRILRAQMTLVDTINVTRALLRKLDQIVKYVPPAFDISRHYLKALDEKLTEEEAVKTESKCDTTKK